VRYGTRLEETSGGDSATAAAAAGFRGPVGREPVPDIRVDREPARSGGGFSGVSAVAARRREHQEEYHHS